MALLSQYDIALLRPALELVDHIAGANVEVRVKVAGNRHLTLDVAEGHIGVKAEYPDSAPAYERFITVQGFCQAYGLPLSKLKKMKED